MGRLRAAPRALAQAAWLTLSKAISGIFTETSGTGPLVSDGTRLFTSGHANLGSTALSLTSYSAARLAMRKQTELNSGERLGALTAPKYLLVPPDLEITALQVLASEHDYTYALSNGTAAPANAFAEGADFQSRMEAARKRVIVVDLWTDTNDWALVADPRLYATIGVGYRYGRAPEIFSVASPTAGLMFTNDTMPVKVRFFFAAGPMDWRGLYKANVSVTPLVPASLAWVQASDGGGETDMSSPTILMSLRAQRSNPSAGIASSGKTCPPRNDINHPSSAKEVPHGSRIPTNHLPRPGARRQPHTHLQGAVRHAAPARLGGEHQRQRRHAQDRQQQRRRRLPGSQVLRRQQHARSLRPG